MISQFIIINQLYHNVLQTYTFRGSKTKIKSNLNRPRGEGGTSGQGRFLNVPEKQKNLE